MDGLAFVKAFRKANRTTPVIMVTNEASKARVLEAIQAGVNNYVVKPFAPETLTRRVRETLAKRGIAA
jgi:two-component system chemotaxis response regulator CheY